MSKRLIGYGYTNANGVATLDYDANGNALQSSGYVGQGVGEIDISASATVDGSTFVSVPCSIWDYLFYDDGITTPKTANWTNYSDRLTVSVDETGTTLFRDASSGTGYYLTPSDYSTPFAIEFEMVDTGTRTSNGIDFALNGSDNNKTFNSLNIASGDTIKITYDGETLRTYRNGSTTPIETALALTGDITIAFYIAPNQSIKFKNFRMYKI